MTPPSDGSKRRAAKTAKGRGGKSRAAKPLVADPHLRPALKGTQGRLFANPQPAPDETSFLIDNTSAAYYKSEEYKRHLKELQAVPPPRSVPPRMDLAEILGGESLQSIVASRKLVFHAVGDTGAAKVDRRQTVEEALQHQGWVADAMTLDVQRGGDSSPSFFFHLGDVVYNWGEEQYYYDQFYEPYRGYDAPIFAIPGNHDGGVEYEHGATTPVTPTLQAFRRNFCAPAAEPAPAAHGLLRSTMTQPGVYFSLDAPYATIIGLYTNVLETVGVISSHGGVYPIGNEQLDFLTAELERLKALESVQKRERAVIVACHHPPVSIDSKSGGTIGLAEDIDRACTQAQFWPDAVLSGHAHLYQHYVRTLPSGKKIPYIVSGSGGFAATPPKGKLEPAPVTFGEYTRMIEPIVHFGYLTVTIDANQSPAGLSIAFRSCDGSETHDEYNGSL